MKTNAWATRVTTGERATTVQAITIVPVDLAGKGPGVMPVGYRRLWLDFTYFCML